MLFASLTKPMAAAAACGLAALVLAAPPVEQPTATASEGVVLTATVEDEEADAPTATIELAESQPASDGEPGASTTGVAGASESPQVTATIQAASKSPATTGTVQQAPASPDLQFGDMALEGRKLSDTEQEELLRERWVEAAQKDPPPFDGEMSLKELQTWHTYWEHQYDALRSQHRKMIEANKQMSGAVSEDKLQLLGADIFKARAEVLRYERELKVRALKNAAAKASAPEAAGGTAGSSSSAEAGTRAPLLDEPAVPTARGVRVAAPVEASSLAVAYSELAPPAEVTRSGFKLVGPNAVANQRVLDALQQSPTEGQSLDFDGVPLAELLEVIGDTCKTPTHINATALEAYGVAADHPTDFHQQGTTIAMALKRALAPLGLAYVVRDGALTITTQDDAQTQLDLAVYSVADLVESNPELAGALPETIKKMVATSTWAENGGGEGAVSILPGGALLVSQSQAVHEEVAALLASLREMQKATKTLPDGAGGFAYGTTAAPTISLTRSSEFHAPIITTAAASTDTGPTTPGNESTPALEFARTAPSVEPTVEELLDQARAQVRKLAVVAKEAAKVREQAGQQGSATRGHLAVGVFEKAGEQIQLNADRAMQRASEILEAEMKQELARIESDGVKDASDFAERLAAVQADLGARTAELARLESLAGLIHARITSPSTTSSVFPDFDLARFNTETLTTDPPRSENGQRGEGVKSTAAAPAVTLSRTAKARTLAPQRVAAFEAVRVPASPESPTAVAPPQIDFQAVADTQMVEQAAASAVLMKEQLAAFERATKELRNGADSAKPATQQMIAQLDAIKGQMQQQLQALQIEGQQGRKLRQEFRFEAVEDKQSPQAMDVLREVPAEFPTKIEFRTSELAPALQELETLRQQNQMLRAELDAMRQQLSAFADARAQWSQPANWNPPQPFTALAPLDKSGRPGKYAGANQQYGFSVQQLQQRLNEVLDPSPKLDVDGDYGPKTVAAVKRLQTAQGLRPSGVADEPTRRAMGLVEVAPAPQATTIESKMWQRVPAAPPVPAAPAAKSFPAIPSVPAVPPVPAAPPVPSAKSIPADLAPPKPEAATTVVPPTPPAPPVTPSPAAGAVNEVNDKLTPEEIKQIVQGLMKDPYGRKLSQEDAQWVKALLLNPERIATFEKARKENPEADATGLWEVWTKHDPDRKADEIRVLDKLIQSEVADKIRSAGIPLAPPKPDGARIKYAKRNSEYGWSVLQLQERLNELLKQSTPLRVDGDYGPLTEAAVKEFQKLRELPVTGSVDDATSAALGFEDKSRTKRAPGSATNNQGVWRAFPEPSAMNSTGWATIAELNPAEHVPLQTPSEDGDPSYLKLESINDSDLLFRIVDPGQPRDGDELHVKAEIGKGSGTMIGFQPVSVRYVGPAAKSDGVVVLIKADALDADSAIVPSRSNLSLDDAHQLLEEIRPGHQLSSASSANRKP
jgi:peptidoglycan hydrolase-like protein with peptidoglycan-binding domain